MLTLAIEEDRLACVPANLHDVSRESLIRTKLLRGKLRSFWQLLATLPKIAYRRLRLTAGITVSMHGDAANVAELLGG